MASGDTHTGIDYWLHIPAKSLYEWLELMNEQSKERELLMKKSQLRR